MENIARKRTQTRVNVQELSLQQSRSKYRRIVQTSPLTTKARKQKNKRTSRSGNFSKLFPSVLFPRLRERISCLFVRDSHTVFTLPELLNRTPPPLNRFNSFRGARNVTFTCPAMVATSSLAIAETGGCEVTYRDAHSKQPCAARLGSTI